MSADDEQDLSSAFEELTAPPSTANFATRTAGLDIRTSSSRWPQAVATVLAVLVAVGGAGTFLALRNARQGGGPAAAIGNPPARSGAAMAFDSAAGVTVMFGGAGASGAPLTDVWTWDGSVWRSAAHGPGPLADVRMVDDPADSGVLLLGMPLQATSGGGVTGCTGSGTASPGSVAGSTPIASTAPSAKSKPSVPTGVPGLTPVRPTGPPLADPIPTGTLTTPAIVSAQPAPSAPTIVCSPAVAAPSEQTWLFSNGGWRQVEAGPSTATPPAGSQLAFDGSTHQVVAVSGGAFSCGYPLAAGVKSSAIACPVMGNSTASSGGANAPCGVVVGCTTFGTVSTWTWSGGRWAEAPATAELQNNAVTLVFNDPATNHATLMTQTGGSAACSGVDPCPAIAIPESVTTWTWAASGWRQVSHVISGQQVPPLAGAAIAPDQGHVVALTTSGETWVFAAGQWTQSTPVDVSHPGWRDGASMAEGPSGSVVLFGGAYVGGLPAVGSSVDADTWVWSDSQWKHVAGRQATPAPAPSCGPQKDGVILPCAVEPQPAQVSPAPALSPTPSP